LLTGLKMLTMWVTHRGKILLYLRHVDALLGFEASVLMECAPCF
jgi:hypothetical protein